MLLCVGLGLLGCTRYDVGTPDTEANRNGFARHIGFAPGTNASRVFYYADELGSDVRYQLAFVCDQSTATGIVTLLKLSPITEKYEGLRPRDDLLWWKADSIAGLPCWSMKETNHEYFRVFWYDVTNRTGFYMEYSM
jgi:hypothetical protein